MEQVCPGVWLDRAGGNSVVLREGPRALLVNACNPALAATLQQVGVQTVDAVLFTHHRRELTDGLPAVLRVFSPELRPPAAEATLFAEPESYWSNPAARWRLLCEHVPYHVTHTGPLPCGRPLVPGETFTWGTWRLEVLATPGYTDGSVTCLARREDTCLAFTGDLIHSPGCIRDLYSLQHGDERGGHRVGDYHGFMGSAGTLMASLERVLQERPDALVPAHGVPMKDPEAAVRALRENLDDLYRNYVSISALRWYFPAYFERFRDMPSALPRQPTQPFPSCVRRLHGTCWVLLADDGHGLLIDPYCDAAAAAAQEALDAGVVKEYDAIWLTHYHHDHTEGAEIARCRFGIPIVADAVMAGPVAQPRRYFLTCLSPVGAHIERRTAHGESWRWRTMTLTAFHFPGQTYYHGGLYAVPDHGPTLFFAGDSLTPTGVDDYCTWNRNHSGPKQGLRDCLELLRDLAPDLIFNQHVNVAFHMPREALDTMLQTLAARAEILRRLLPWPHPDMGTDEAWVHTDPYEQTAAPGAEIEVAVCIQNFLPHVVQAQASWCLPAAWLSEGAATASVSAPCPAGREAHLCLPCRVPEAARGRWVLPVRVSFAGQDLGSFREAIVEIAEDKPGERQGQRMQEHDHG